MYGCRAAVSGKLCAGGVIKVRRRCYEGFPYGSAAYELMIRLSDLDIRPFMENAYSCRCSVEKNGYSVTTPKIIFPTTETEVKFNQADTCSRISFGTDFRQKYWKRFLLTGFFDNRRRYGVRTKILLNTPVIVIHASKCAVITCICLFFTIYYEYTSDP